MKRFLTSKVLKQTLRPVIITSGCVAGNPAQNVIADQMHSTNRSDNGETAFSIDLPAKLSLISSVISRISLLKKSLLEIL